MIKAAVTGMGFMGKTHIGIYQRLDNVELSAICDASEERLNIESLESEGNIQTSSEEIDLSQRLKRWARARGQRFVIQKKHPVLTSDRKIRLYGRRELARSMFRILISPRKSVRDPKRCFTWYDGKR